MQYTITPIAPVQSGPAASQARTASMSANTPPRRARASRMIEIMQAAVPRPWNRSGATARYPAPASQPAWFLRSWLIPSASWMTTTPGHGPGPSGAAR